MFTYSECVKEAVTFRTMTIISVLFYDQDNIDIRTTPAVNNDLLQPMTTVILSALTKKYPHL